MAATPQRNTTIVRGFIVVACLVLAGATYLLIRPGCREQCINPVSHTPLAGGAVETAATANNTMATPSTGQHLIADLLQGSFPAVQLHTPHSAPRASLLNGPMLSDKQLNAGVRGEVQVGLGGEDAVSTIAYDVFISAADAKVWFQAFTLGMYGQYRIHGKYAPNGINSARCEQYADTSAGRAAGGTQCFALAGNVVVYGDSLIYDTASGNAADAETMLKAGLAYLNTVRSAH